MSAEGTVADVLAGRARYAVVCGDAAEVLRSIDDGVAAAIVTDAAPLIVLPVGGYTVKVSAPSLRTTIIAPTSTVGSLTPVPEAVVAERTTTALTDSASVAEEPVAVTAACTSPQIAWADPPD